MERYKNDYNLKGQKQWCLAIFCFVCGTEKVIDNNLLYLRWKNLSIFVLSMSLKRGCGVRRFSCYGMKVFSREYTWKSRGIFEGFKKCPPLPSMQTTQDCLCFRSLLRFRHFGHLFTSVHLLTFVNFHFRLVHNFRLLFFLFTSKLSQLFRNFDHRFTFVFTLYFCSPLHIR